MTTLENEFESGIASLGRSRGRLTLAKSCVEPGEGKRTASQ